MSLTDWLSESSDRVRTNGLEGVHTSVYELYVGMLRRLGRFYNYGETIHERDWDVLIVLDACRADLMSEVIEDYDFINSSEPFVSAASTSEEWMEKTFLSYPEETSEIAYITGNPFSDEYLDESMFAEFDEVWKYAWDREMGTIPARPITDRAIHYKRSNPNGKLVIHYMQPHYPFVDQPMDEGMSLDTFGSQDTDTVWDKLRRGKIAKQDVWERYRDNLKYVLEDVELLVQSVDSTNVVITADHGNALGEYGVYGHPGYAPLPSIKRVPWVQSTATDTGDYDPKTKAELMVSQTSEDVEERLQDLGYT